MPTQFGINLVFGIPEHEAEEELCKKIRAKLPERVDFRLILSVNGFARLMTFGPLGEVSSYRVGPDAVLYQMLDSERIDTEHPC